MDDREYCYKLCRLTDKPNKYMSRLPNAVSLIYSVGKKTKPITGPIFAYYQDRLRSMKGILYEIRACQDIGVDDLVILEAEFKPYPKPVERIVSPIVSAYVTADKWKEFWTTGTIVGVPQDSFEHPFKPFVWEVILFCDWVKPVRQVDISEIEKKIEELQ